MELELPFVKFWIRATTDLLAGTTFSLLFGVSFILLILSINDFQNTEKILIASVLGLFTIGFINITRNRLKWHKNFICQLRITEEQVIISYYSKNDLQEIIKINPEEVDINFSGNGWGAAHKLMNLKIADLTLIQAARGGWNEALFAETLQALRNAQNKQLTWDEQDWYKRLTKG